MSATDVDSVEADKCEDDDCQNIDQLVFYCHECDCSFCNVCWNKQPAHRPNKRGAAGRQHEKIDRAIVQKYQEILESTTIPREQAQLHGTDEDTTWFGVGRDENGDPTLQDYPRYASLMVASTSEKYQTRYPQLVSFIGQTGE